MPPVAPLAFAAPPRLKEADAFQRLVCERVPEPVRDKPASKKQTPFSVWYEDELDFIDVATPVPQRSRRLSASGIGSGATNHPRGILNASKKQTPFSVWYPNTPRRSRSAGDCASKKQTPFSVWYKGRQRQWTGRYYPASKKQTPFSVWYRSVRACGASAINGPQRSRRLSASGISTTELSWSCASSPQRSRRLSASGMRNPYGE